MSTFELWWVLIALPFSSLIAALLRSWNALLQAGSEYERQTIINRAAIRGMLDMVIVGGAVVAPWPYKMIFFVPTLVSVTACIVRRCYSPRFDKARFAGDVNLENGRSRKATKRTACERAD